MKTCGMMGEVVGKASSLCAIHDCSPRDVYQDHLPELLDLLKLPGKARRSTPSAEIVIPADALPLAGPHGPPSGRNPAKIEGIVVDDKQAELKGKWTSGQGLKNYVGYSYLYAGSDSGATATFTLKVTKPGTYRLQMFSQAHPNRATQTPVEWKVGKRRSEVKVDQRTKSKDDLVTLGEFQLQAQDSVVVTIGCKNAGGNVHVDAVRLIEIK